MLISFSFVQVLELLACNWKRKCISSSCWCTDSGLNCADACANQQCDNMAFNKIVSNNDVGYSDDDDNKDDNDFYV